MTRAVTDATLKQAGTINDNLMYLESLNEYIDDLSSKMRYTKSDSALASESADTREKIRISKQLYNGIMRWDANDFGSIIRNQGFFQRGV